MKKHSENQVFCFNEVVYINTLHFLFVCLLWTYFSWQQLIFFAVTFTRILYLYLPQYKKLNQMDT